MKLLIPLMFALSVCATPAFSWGWGDCPHSNKGETKEASIEKVNKEESAQEK